MATIRACAALLLLAAAHALVASRWPRHATALHAKKRKQKGAADHSAVDDWTGRRRRRIKDDVEAALDDPNWVAVHVLVVKKEVPSISDRLVAAGGKDILVLALSNCRL